MGKQTRAQLLRNLKKARAARILKKRLLISRLRYKQTGKTNLARDKGRKAAAPGYRTSRNGKRYFEARKNRSDIPPGRV